MKFDGQPTTPTETLSGEAAHLIEAANYADKQANELEAEATRLRERSRMLRAFAEDHMEALARFEQKAKELL